MKEWENYFVLTSTGAVTLIGLLFAVITLVAGRGQGGDKWLLRTFLMPTLFHFGVVFLIILLALSPAGDSLMLSFGLIGIAGLVYRNSVMKKMILSLWQPTYTAAAYRARCILRKSTVLAWIAVTPVVSGCVESQKPILTNTAPIIGHQFEVHLYDTFEQGKAHNFRALRYRWLENKYDVENQPPENYTEVAGQQLDENNFIIQTHGGNDTSFHYAIARRLFEGVFLIFPVEQAYADAATIVKICGKNSPDSICVIQSYDQLITLARATAAVNAPLNPMLGVMLTADD